MVYALWFMVYGLWFMVFALWFMVYSLWIRFQVLGSGLIQALHLKHYHSCSFFT